MNWLTSFKVKCIPGYNVQAQPAELEDGQQIDISETEVDFILSAPEENDGVLPDDRKDADDEQEKLAAVGLLACQQLHDLTDSLNQVKLNTSPLFVRVGRDLQDIFGETKTLTDSVRHFADCVKGGEGEKSSLDSTRQLIQEISQILFKDQQEIEYNLIQIHELLSNLSKFHHVYDAIDRISASFRVVRINIQIQCTVQSISEDLFKGVSGDITSLSKKLDQITKQIKKDLYAAEKNMTGLNKTVSKNLQKIKQGAEQAKGVVARAFAEIEQLVQGALTMMQNAGENSDVILQKVGEVVVSIQFHDSMSQRIEHTVQAFNDIEQLLSENELTPGHFGTAFFILDLQHRQLVHLISEVGSIRGNIEKSFESMGAEVKQLNSIMQFLQLKGAGQQQHLDNKFSVLQNALMRLCEIFSQSGKMVSQINSSTDETTTVADSLMRDAGYSGRNSSAGS